MAIVGIAMLLVLALARVSPGLGSQDPLAAEIERWSAFLRGDAASHGIWVRLRQGDQPALARAEPPEPSTARLPACTGRPRRGSLHCSGNPQGDEPSGRALRPGVVSPLPERRELLEPQRLERLEIGGRIVSGPVRGG